MTTSIRFPPTPGSEFIKQLPEAATPERERMILDMLRKGDFLDFEWFPLDLEQGDDFLTIYVMTDALCIGTPEDYFRINVSHDGAQRAADILDAQLMTTKISDLVHQYADVIITPCTQKPDAQMAYTHRMLAHSQAVDKKLEGGASTVEGRSPLVSTVGKDWVLSNSLIGNEEKGVNFGWHVSSGSKYRSPGGLQVLQPGGGGSGMAHDRWHVDYSQILRLVGRRVLLNGRLEDIDTILMDPELHKFLSDEGQLRLTRHPGVPLDEIPDTLPAT